MIEVLDEQYDHGAIFYNEDPYRELLKEMIALWDQNPSKLHFVWFVPTAENLAMYWFAQLHVRLHEKGIKLAHVKVYETPTSTATCTANENFTLKLS